MKVRGRRVALHRRDVGVVFQDHRLLTDRSVFDNIALPLILRGMRRGEIGRRVRSVLEQLGLGERERALPTQLSAGEQPRIGIARAVVSEPRLLVAEERKRGGEGTSVSVRVDVGGGRSIEKKK